jgi:hypothetical protein
MFNTTNSIAEVKVMHSYFNLDGTRNFYFVPVTHAPSVPDYVATNDLTFIFIFGQD